MRSSVRTNRDAGVRSDNFYVLIVVADGRPYLLPVAPGIKHGVGGHEGNLPHGSHARSNCGHVLLANAHLNKALRILFCKEVCFC